MKVIQLPKSIPSKKQEIYLDARNIPGTVFYMSAKIQWDDKYENGHNTFSITGDVKTKEGNVVATGMCHREFITVFSEYAHLIKWHLIGSNGPMYYLENVLYHANEHPSNKGWIYEGKRFLKSPNPDKEIEILERCIYYGSLEELEAVVKANPELNLWIKPDEKTEKKADLEAARQVAIAPYASLEQLRDRQWLIERLPSLMEEFKRDIEALGFVY